MNARKYLLAGLAFLVISCEQPMAPTSQERVVTNAHTDTIPMFTYDSLGNLAYVDYLPVFSGTRGGTLYIKIFDPIPVPVEQWPLLTSSISEETPIENYQKRYVKDMRSQLPQPTSRPSDEYSLDAVDKSRLFCGQCHAYWWNELQ